MTPTMRLISPGEDIKKFVWEGDLHHVTVHHIKKFIEEFNEGKLKPFLKSQDIEETIKAKEAGEPVTVLVGKNWEEIV